MLNLLQNLLSRGLYLAEGTISSSPPGQAAGNARPAGPAKPPGAGKPPPQGGPAPGSPPGDGAHIRNLAEGDTDPADVRFPGKPPAGPPGTSPADRARQEQTQASLEATEALIRAAADPNQETRLGATESLRQLAETTRNPDVLRRLARLDNAQFNSVLMGVAGNHHTPEDTFRHLASDGDPFVVTELAGNRSAPADVLDRLARNPDPRGVASEGTRRVLQAAVQEAMAGNQNLAPATLEFLAEHGTPRARLEVAQNRGTPIAVLERMARQVSAEEQASGGGSSGAIETRIAELQRQMNTAVQQNQRAQVTELAAQLRESRSQLEALQTAPQIRAAAQEELARRANESGTGPSRGGKR